MGGNSLQYGRNLPTSRTMIVGASGELGGAIARLSAKRGDDLLLLGRNHQRLDRIAADCEVLGASAVQTATTDLMDLASTCALIESSDEAAPARMLIIASGLGDIRAPGDLVEDARLVQRLGQVNYLAPSVIAAEMAGRMARRGGGRIVLIGSAAGFHPMPFSIAYSASKAGLARFADGLRIAVAPYGVIVTLASPGFIDTAAARKVPGPKPFALEVDEAARRILAASDKGRPHIITPWPFAVVRIIERALPRAVSDRLLRALTPKRGLQGD